MTDVTRLRFYRHYHLWFVFEGTYLVGVADKLGEFIKWTPLDDERSLHSSAVANFEVVSAALAGHIRRHKGSTALPTGWQRRRKVAETLQFSRPATLAQVRVFCSSAHEVAKLKLRVCPIDRMGSARHELAMFGGLVRLVSACSESSVIKAELKRFALARTGLPDNLAFNGFGR